MSDFFCIFASFINKKENINKLKYMKKSVIIVLLMVLGMSAMAQQKIQLRSTDKAECEKSDMTSLRASFSFSTIGVETVATQRGEFSWLSMPNTVIGGNEGDPQIPVINELIAVPVGANPVITVTAYSSTDYSLEDLGITTLIPRQPSLRKDKRPEDVPFVYNEAAYQTRGMRSEPRAMVSVEGTMRGVRLGKMTIEPVSYDPVNNTLRVFNDIEVEVTFDNADARATEDLLLETYSPYFNIVYKQLFNGRAVLDAYTDHPDLYKTPVKMLVVTTSTYANSTAFQNWLAWKKQKGIDVDVQTVANNASASTIQSLIYSRYNVNHPSFLVLVGDETVVTYYSLWDYDSSYGNAATDLEYASVDGDVYHDMFLSRMPVSSTTELGNLVNKILTYEKYTMSDPSYLDETLLIAGWDSSATAYIGQPTIQYASNYYFNSAHGINAHVFLTTASGQTTCYNYINNVGFVNYTAHGDIQKWHDPQFTNSDVNSLTNNDKYFWAMGNCCLTANFKNAQNNQTCFGEAMVRAANKGAFGYIGSVPESLWYEDYYFAVGATNTFGQMPTQAQTSTGVYDAMFDDTGFNTLNAVPYIGNVAVTYAHAGSYQSSVDDEYYWRAYQCFGDGSVMPYLKNPSANVVSHNSTITVGASSFTVSAVAGSYVAVTKDNEILGVAQVPTSGSVNVPISGLTTTGDVMVVVTRQQRQPYITTIQAISTSGPYISLDSYTPETAIVGDVTGLSMTFKNVGSAATSGSTTVTLTSTDTSAATVITGTRTFNTLAANASTTVSGFNFRINASATLGSDVTLHYKAVNGSNSWEGDLTITADQIFNVTAAANNDSYGTVSGGGQYHYNTLCTVTATPADGYLFTSWTMNNVVVSTDTQYTFNVTSDVLLVANFAEGVVIGSGTTTNDMLPAYSYYTNSLTEQIYTSAELGSGGLITSIAFYNGGAVKTLNCDFYMKATTKSSFTGKTDWITVTASDLVFSGSVTYTADDWTTIVLSTPFAYDGTSNVVLVTDKKTQWSYSPHMSCRVFNATNQALYIYDDNTDYSPLSPPTSEGSYNSVLSVKNQLIITKQSEDMFNITAVSNPTEGGFVAFGGKGGRSELFYDFEDGTSQGWTLLKGSNGTSPNNWMHNTEYTPRDYTSGYGYDSSDGFMLSESYISTSAQSSGTAVYPDNYLVSPQVKLGGSIHFYATDVNDSYGEEHFAVAVSKGGNTDVDDFTQVAEWTLLSRTITDGTWYEFTADLSAYQGMGYIAIHHFDCYDQWLLCVDNITITEGEGLTSISGTFADGHSCTVTATPNPGYDFANWTENGTVVSSSPSYTFIVNDDRDLVANFAATYNITIKGYGNSSNGWYLLSSPLAGDTDPATVNNMTSNDFDIFRFNQSADMEWESWIQEGGHYHFIIESGRGYLYANKKDVVLTFSGLPYTGNGEVILKKDDNASLAGWNLIGNPFGTPATINGKSFYVMNEERSNLIVSEKTEIGAMEGVFVTAETDGETVVFEQNKGNSNGEWLALNLNRDGDKVVDRVIVRFDDCGLLKKYAINDNTSTIYIPKQDNDYAVVNGIETTVIPVNFEARQIGMFTLNANVMTDNVSYLHLIDKLTGEDVDMLLDGSYTFAGSANDRKDRFVLRLSHDNADENSTFAYQSGSDIIVSGDGTLQVFDVMGRLVATREIHGVETMSVSSLQTGAYIFRIIGENINTQKIIVK